MSIIGNALSAGGISENDFSLLRIIYDNSSITETGTITISKDSFSKTLQSRLRNDNTNSYSYYATIPSTEFSSSQPFSISADTESYFGSMSILIPDSGFYHDKIVLNKKEFVIWDSSLYNSTPSSSPAGGFTALKGTASGQSDTIAYSSGSPALVSYTENNNDYGGIRINNPISFNGYSKLKITFNNINSWQYSGTSPADPSYVAKVVIGTGSTNQLSDHGYPTGGSFTHVDNWQMTYVGSDSHISNISTNFSVAYSSGYTGNYYIYMLVASGEKSGAGKGQLQISKIWLEK